MSDPGHGGILRGRPDQHIIGIVIAHGLYIAQVAQISHHDLIGQTIGHLTAVGILIVSKLQLCQFTCGRDGPELSLRVTGQGIPDGAIAGCLKDHFASLQIYRVQSALNGVHDTCGVVIGHILGIHSLLGTNGLIGAVLHIVAIELAIFGIAVEAAVMTVVVTGNKVYGRNAHSLIVQGGHIHLNHVAVRCRSTIIVVGIEAAGDLHNGNLAGGSQFAVASGNGGAALAHSRNDTVGHSGNGLITGSPAHIRQLHIPGDGVDLHLGRLPHIQQQIRGIQPDGGGLGGIRNLVLRLVQSQKTDQLVVGLIGLAGGSMVGESGMGISVVVGRINGQKLRNIAGGTAAEISPVELAIGKGHGLAIVGAHIGAGVILKDNVAAIFVLHRGHSVVTVVHVDGVQIGTLMPGGIDGTVIANGDVVQATGLMTIVAQHGQLTGQHIQLLQLHHGGAGSGHHVHGVGGVIKGHIQDRNAQVGNDLAIPQTGLDDHQIVASIHGEDHTAHILRCSQSIGLQAIIGNPLYPGIAIFIGGLCKLDPAVHIVLADACIVDPVGIQEILVQLRHIIILGRAVGQLKVTLVGGVVTQNQLEFGTLTGDIKGHHLAAVFVSLKGDGFSQNPGTVDIHQLSQSQVHFIRGHNG